MTREHDSMQKNLGSNDLEHCGDTGPDFTCLEGVPEGSGSPTVVGNMNPMSEMDSAHSKTYLGRESMSKPTF